MKKPLLGVALNVALATSVYAQAVDPNPAFNNPDKVSWELFALVTKPAGANVVFETWASNEDTFQQAIPRFPGAPQPPTCTPLVVAGGPQPVPPQPQAAITPTASPKILNVPALIALAPREPGLQPHVVGGATDDEPSEETRRNKATFDFIICNKLHTRAGLRVAFAAGQPISFPIDSIEVKANWVPLGTRNPADYYVNTADGKKYALVAMHIISKLVPNWTWATFEHKDNAGRCDFTGCHDNFGALVQNVDPHPPSSLGGRYDPCVKTPAVKKIFTDAGLPPLWENYCLKGSQVDYVTATGVPVRLGNSVTEKRFDNTSSCMTCHARAAVNAQGQRTTTAGFLNPPVAALCPTGNPCSPNGAPNPAWFWTNPGDPAQSMIALQTDFIWSVARQAR